MLSEHGPAPTSDRPTVCSNSHPYNIPRGQFAARRLSRGGGGGAPVMGGPAVPR
jgi:hypothetical protein